MKMRAMIVSAVLVFSGVFGATATEVECDIDGATPGKWTMDFEAAKKVATEKNLPILLDFSGTDWCSWCKLMEENIFMKPEWSKYATENMVMVLVDFPADKSRVPEKYVARNRALSEKYGVSTFPTFILLDNDGELVLGRMGAGRNKTPKSFLKEVKGLLRYRPSVLEAYCAQIGEEQAVAYRALLNELIEKKEASKAAAVEVIRAQNNANSKKGAIVNMEKRITAFRIAQYSEAKRAAYAVLTEQRAKLGKEFSTWLRSKPEESKANAQKKAAMQAQISTLDREIEMF